MGVCPCRLHLPPSSQRGRTAVRMRWGSGSPRRSPTIRTPGRVRALIGRRMKKQARRAGTHEVCDAASCERRHAARPVEPPAGRTAVFGGKRFPVHQGRPSPATAQQRVQVSHREDCLRHDAGDRRRGQVVGSSRLARPAARVHGPPTCPPRSGGRSPTARLLGAAESCGHRFGARRLGEDSRDCARSPRP